MSRTDSRRAAVVVAEWIDRTVGDLPVESVARLFGAALIAIWNRARIALGDVSLNAITSRVLRGARVRFPRLRVLDIVATPEAFAALGTSNLDGADRQELIDAARFVLTEVLALLGILTAEILTPALYEALCSVGPTAAGSAPSERERETS